MIDLAVTRIENVIVGVVFTLDNAAAFAADKYPSLAVCIAIETMIAAKSWSLGADVESFLSRFMSDYGQLSGSRFAIEPSDMHFPDHVAALM